MAKNLITVWNASQSIVKVGSNKMLIKPALSARVERDATVDKLINAGKLVIIADVVIPNDDIEEDTPVKKKLKKDSVQAEQKEENETTVSEEPELIVSQEILEDSILPEETA